MLKFEYCAPTKIIFGQNSILDLGKSLLQINPKKILFHYGQQSIKANGLYDLIVEELKETRIPFIELGGVRPNPNIDLVRFGVDLARKEKVDFILAVGGGSVIDSAKAIACGAVLSPEIDPWLLNTNFVVPTQALPLGVVLTIAASGSEMSNSCVISNSITREKLGFNSELIRPVFALLDPLLTVTVDPFQTACGIVDILMHTLERFLTDTPDIDLCLNIGIGLMKSVIDAGRRVISDPSDANARATLMLAGSLSHNGLTGLGGKFYFTLHKLEHSLTAQYGVAHGLGLAILFKSWAVEVYEMNPNFRLFAQEVMNVEGAILGIDALVQFFSEIGLKTTLHENGIILSQEDIEEIVSRLTVNGDVPGFVPITKELACKIYQNAK